MLQKRENDFMGNVLRKIVVCCCIKMRFPFSNDPTSMHKYKYFNEVFFYQVFNRIYE